MLCRIKNKRGFTLIELAVAGILISVSVVALYYMFLQSNVFLREQNIRRTALEKIKGLLIEIQNSDYECNSDHFFAPVELVSPDEESKYPGLFANVEVEMIPDDERSLCKVIITFSWIVDSGRKYSMVLADYHEE